ncbi:MAG TPA: hypothetical protein VKA38_04845 [Draconibacterium sp.]|nr:hypothetical protein [Draconibacterium sp.]
MVLSCQQKPVLPAAVDEQTIVNQITGPVIPESDVNILNYGAVGDSLTNCKPAFDKATEAIKEKGVAKSLYPPGNTC